MRQEKEYGAKKFIVEYPSKSRTLSALNKLLWKIETDEHFTLWGDLTKAAVTIICIGRFNWNFALWLLIDGAPLQNDVFQRNSVVDSAVYWRLSVQNFILIRSDLTFLLYNVYSIGGLFFYRTQCMLSYSHTVSMTNL